MNNLMVKETDIQKIGVKAIADAVKFHPTVAVLDLSCKQIMVALITVYQIIHLEKKVLNVWQILYLLLALCADCMYLVRYLVYKI